MPCFISLCAIVASLCFDRAMSAPNFVFVLTDDQDLLLDGLLPMKKTLELVANEGVTFTNAFVNSPICCPSRSTILTGKYIHNLRVFNNSLSGNCSSRSWQESHEKKSIANLLKTKNYTTFYAGKYLNQYGSKHAGGLKHVPPGYDWWLGLEGNSKYYNYSLSINGTKKDFGEEYLTDIISGYASDFLNQKFLTKTPFFMMLAPPACHSPFTPAPRHKDKFANTKAVRTPAFNYSAVDKHWLVGMRLKHLPEDVTILDEIQQHRLESLLAVDEMVEKLAKKLAELSVLDNSYIIYTSDNGFHIGQFSQPWDKRQPYETDIKVPFFVRGPNIKQKMIVNKPISAIDIAPTILDLAGLNIPEDMDGVSFKNQMVDIEETEKIPGINHIFIEYFGEGNSKTIDKSCHIISNDLAQCTNDNWCKCQDSRNNTYVCVKIFSKFTDFKYCQFYDDLNFIEAYDLRTDPFELENIKSKLTNKQLTYFDNLITRFSSYKNL